MSRFVTIGGAARASGVPEWRLRAWESAGLLTPVRSAAGYRLFDESAINRARKLAEELDGGERLATMALAYESSLEIEPVSRETSITSECSTAQSAQELELVRNVAHLLQSTDDTQRATDDVLASLTEFIRADAATLNLADRVRQKIQVYSALGLSAKFASYLDRWKLNEGFGGQVYALREPFMVSDLLESAKHGRDMISAEGLRAYACVPLYRGSRRVGLLELYRRNPESFSLKDLALLETVAAVVTPYVEAQTIDIQLQNLHNERARHFRTLVSQFSSTQNRQRQLRAARMITLAEEFEMQLRVDGPSAARRLRTLMASDIQRDESGFDLLDLMRTGIIERFEQEEGLRCVLKVGSWPTTLSTAHASRVYLLLLRIAEDLSALAETYLSIYVDSSADELWIEFTYDPGVRQPDVSYSPGSETIEIIKEMQGTLGANRSAESSRVNVLLPRREDGHFGDLLTRRERQILEVIGAGKTNRDVAAQLEISTKTLQNHLTAIYRKLQVVSRTEAVAFLDQ